MNRKRLEESIYRAVNQAPAIEYENLARIPVEPMEQHDFITRQIVKKPVQHVNYLGMVAAFCLLVVLGSIGWWQFRMPDSVILIDINPSIQIITNRQEQVLSVKALNADAESVIAEVNAKPADLTGMVVQIVDAAIQKGYLSPQKNVVLVSVENRNLKKADALARSLNDTVKESAKAKQVMLGVLRQSYAKDKDLEELASQHQLSEGKLRVIQTILAADPELSLEKLSKMSMTQLLDYARKNKIDLQKTVEFDDEYYSYDNDAQTKESEDFESTDEEENGATFEEDGADSEDEDVVLKDREKEDSKEDSRDDSDAEDHSVAPSTTKKKTTPTVKQETEEKQSSDSENKTPVDESGLTKEQQSDEGAVSQIPDSESADAFEESDTEHTDEAAEESSGTQEPVESE